MRRLLLIALALVAAAALLPAVASAASPATLKVRACATGETKKQRYVTFYGHMNAVPGTARMLMRFTLIDRSSDGASVVNAPRRLSKWKRSRPGVRSFGYAQTVTALQAGGAYAAIVEFRWVDVRGKTIKSLRRTSSDCRQDGDLPNLAITRVAAKAGDATGTELYSVDVTNRGSGPAKAFKLDLIVDGAAADAAALDGLEPGQTKTVEISGPACRSRIRVVADRSDAVAETTDDDNSRRQRCPAVAR